jgi:hypothetical protein
LHQIFITPNPEHVYGLPLHPRGKEAAEMWHKHFQKELVKQKELQKQMFVVSMRRQLDLIKRFQQGKLPPQEIEAILTEVRERDAQVFLHFLLFFLNILHFLSLGSLQENPTNCFILYPRSCFLFPMEKLNFLKIVWLKVLNYLYYF